MATVIYWLWLTIKPGVTNSVITKLLTCFNTIEDIYFSKNFNNIYGITEKDKQHLLNKDLSDAKKVMEDVYKLGGRIIVYDDKNYPQILKNISNPPYVLYIRGKIFDFDKALTIGVVGTRRSSVYGDKVTNEICSNLAASGVVTVTGMAAGIDTAAAWATLKNNGIVAGVIAGGLDIVYPRENENLYKAVIENGCIITEYPPETPPLRPHFPTRNRIIAGLSRGVLVTEAPKRSGALITARYAIDYNRDVFAVPRGITDKYYLGANILIQQGAKLVNNAEDILVEYPYAEKIQPKPINSEKTEYVSQSVQRTDGRTEKRTAENNIKKTEQNEKKYSNLNEKEKSIIELLKSDDMQIDEMARELGVSVSDLNTRLILLECKGIIKRLPASKYQLNI